MDEQAELLRAAAAARQEMLEQQSRMQSVFAKAKEHSRKVDIMQGIMRKAGLMMLGSWLTTRMREALQEMRAGWIRWKMEEKDRKIADLMAEMAELRYSARA